MSIFPTNDPAYAAVLAEESAMVNAAEVLAEALEKSEMTRADLARALHVKPSEVTARLRGERNITVRSLAATLHALGQTLEFKCVQSPHLEEDKAVDRWKPLIAARADEQPHAVFDSKGWVIGSLVS